MADQEHATLAFRTNQGCNLGYICGYYCGCSIMSSDGKTHEASGYLHILTDNRIASDHAMLIRDPAAIVLVALNFTSCIYCTFIQVDEERKRRPESSDDATTWIG